MGITREMEGVKALVLCLLVAAAVGDVADLAEGDPFAKSGDVNDANDAGGPGGVYPPKYGHLAAGLTKLSTDEIRVLVKKEAMASSICHVAWQHLRADPKCAIKPSEEDLGEGMEVETSETSFAYAEAMQAEIQNAVARKVEPAKEDLKKADAKKKAAAAKKKAEKPPKSLSSHSNAQEEGVSQVDGMKRDALIRMAKLTQTSIAVCKRSYQLAKKHCTK